MPQLRLQPHHPSESDLRLNKQLRPNQPQPEQDSRPNQPRRPRSARQSGPNLNLNPNPLDKHPFTASPCPGVNTLRFLSVTSEAEERNNFRHLLNHRVPHPSLKAFPSRVLQVPVDVKSFSSVSDVAAK